jgi:hypothetical protein
MNGGGQEKGLRSGTLAPHVRNIEKIINIDFSWLLVLAKLAD